MGVLAFLALGRCVLAAQLDLGNDEVYYTTVYGNDYRWAYFDHPPMIGWLIRLFTLHLQLRSNWAVRLPAIVSAAFTAYWLYRTAERLAGRQAGWWALALHTTSIYNSIIAGVFVLPDSPMLACWAWALYRAVVLVQLPRPGWKPWLLFGLAVGLGLLCKVSAAYLWVGLGLFVLWQRRLWLLEIKFYAAGLFSALFLLPVLWWNWQHQFVTYSFHSQRVNSWQQFQASSLLREWLGNVAYANPVNYAWLLLAGWWLFRRRAQLSATGALLVCMGLPLIAMLLLLSAFRDTLPHWSGPGYLSLWVLVAAVASTETAQRWLRVAGMVFAAVVMSGLGLIHAWPGTLGSKETANLGQGDFTLDLWGWEAAGKSWQTKGKQYPLAWPVVAAKWFPASHLHWYLLRPEGRSLTVLGNFNDLHEWLLVPPPTVSPLAAGDTALYLLPSHLADQAALGQLSQQFRQLALVDSITQLRMNKPARTIFIYRLSGYQAQ